MPVAFGHPYARRRTPPHDGSHHGECHAALKQARHCRVPQVVEAYRPAPGFREVRSGRGVPSLPDNLYCLVSYSVTSRANPGGTLPRWPTVSPRSGRIYQPGIGPHPEDRAVDLIVAELSVLRPHWRIPLRQCYPGSKQTCVLLWGIAPTGRSRSRCFARTATTGGRMTPLLRTSCRHTPRIAARCRTAPKSKKAVCAAPSAADLRIRRSAKASARHDCRL